MQNSKVSWGALFGAVPVVYIFFDPWARRASALEWVLTAAAYLLFCALYTTGVILWANKRALRAVCAGLLLLAIAFTAYRFSGAAFFVIVAAFVPFAVDGDLRASTALLLGVVCVLLLESWFIGWAERGNYGLILSAETLLLGAGVTFSTRQRIALEHSQRVAERERIARDLHDILGHTLSVITLKSELAGRLVEGNPTRARAEIADVERISRQALADVRDAIRGYHAGDLPAEFERAASTLETAGIRVEHSCERLDIPPPHERILVLALREAVTNIVRHAHATHCRMALSGTTDGYRLDVHDDGRGGAQEEGLGLRGIRDRVEAAGGTVSWSLGAGAALTIVLPSAAATKAESAS